MLLRTIGSFGAPLAISSQNADHPARINLKVIRLIIDWNILVKALIDKFLQRQYNSQLFCGTYVKNSYLVVKKYCSYGVDFVGQDAP